MVVIHMAYATLKMPGSKGIITIKANQLNTLAYGNMSLSHVGHFGDKATQDQAAKVTKTQGRQRRSQHIDVQATDQ
jgi:hypothetical protein